MTDHEVIAWKMDEQNAAIMSIQSTQMWNNINSSGNYQRNINQQIIMIELEILFPTCNSEKKFISESLEAIKRQTFKDFKLLIIDNQSTDKTIDIITKSGLPFKVISKKDLSFNDGIKKGLKMIKAKYFTSQL